MPATKVPRRAASLPDLPACSFDRALNHGATHAELAHDGGFLKMSRRACAAHNLSMLPIQSHGLILRPFEWKDADAFALAARESARTVGRWMPWCQADYTVDEARNWFDMCAQGLTSRTSFEFGLFSNDGREFLGGAGLNHFNVDHNFCNLGYWVRQSRQRQGIALHAARSLAEFGFQTLGLTRIEIVVAVGNEPSAALARKLGAVFECVARNRLMIGYEPVAASVYSLVPPTI